MSKGLEALEKIKELYKSYVEKIGLNEKDILGFDLSFASIEKELKQAQKDKEVLNVFKNALTIKRTYVLPKERDSSDDTFSYACRYLYEITQNDIDEKMRKSLREWVLKNAFPEEVKSLEIIKENALYVDWIWLFDCVVNNKSYEDYVEGCEATKETTYADKKEYDLFREVLK